MPFYPISSPIHKTKLIKIVKHNNLLQHLPSTDMMKRHPVKIEFVKYITLGTVRHFIHNSLMVPLTVFSHDLILPWLSPPLWGALTNQP